MTVWFPLREALKKENLNIFQKKSQINKVRSTGVGHIDTNGYLRKIYER